MIMKTIHAQVEYGELSNAVQLSGCKRGLIGHLLSTHCDLTPIQETVATEICREVQRDFDPGLLGPYREHDAIIGRNIGGQLMAGDWIPYFVDTARKPEVLMIARNTKRTRHEVIGLLLEFWAWCQSVTHDRLLERLTPGDVCVAVGGDDTFWNAVQDVGWVLFKDEGIEIPNADSWLSKGAKSRLLATQRQKKWRENTKKSVDASVDGSASTNASPEERREKESIKKSKPKEKFVPPTATQVEQYVNDFTESFKANPENAGKQWPLKPIDADYFVDYWAQSNWQRNNKPIKDWRATVRNWGRNDFGNVKPAKDASADIYPDFVPEGVAP